MWSTLALLRTLPRSQSGRCRKHLAAVAFRFLNGPWQKLWVRRGYDPRRLPPARAFQTVAYKSPLEWYPTSTREGKKVAREAQQQAAAQGRPAPTAGRRGDQAAVLALAALPPRRSTFFCLADVTHPDIRALVEQEPQAGGCSEHSGWFSKPAMDAIKAVLKQGFDAAARAEGLHAPEAPERKNAATGRAARAAAALAQAKAAAAARPLALEAPPAQGPQARGGAARAGPGAGPGTGGDAQQLRPAGAEGDGAATASDEDDPDADHAPEGEGGDGDEDDEYQVFGE